MSDGLGLSVGTTNLVAASGDLAPITRRSVLTLFNDRAPEVGEYAGPNQPRLVLTGFVERVGDPVPLVASDGSSHRGEIVLTEALDAIGRAAGGGSPVTIAVPAHWGPGVVGALRSALRAKPALAPGGVPPTLIPDSAAALAGLRAAPGLPPDGVVVLCDFGAGGTSITLADAHAGLAIIGDTVRYPDFSGDLIDQSLLNHVIAGIADARDSDPASTAAVGSLTRLRDECRQAKERLSADTAAVIPAELPGFNSDVRVTRAELERLIEQPLAGLVGAVEETLQRYRIPLASVSAVATVGGGAAVPLVTQSLSERLRAPVVTTPAPQLVAATGATAAAASGFGADAPTGMGPVADAPTGLAPTMGWVAGAPQAGPPPAGPPQDATASAASLAWSQDEPGSGEPVPYAGGEYPLRLRRPDRRPSSGGIRPRGGGRPSRLGAVGLVQAAAHSVRRRRSGSTSRDRRVGGNADQYVRPVHSGDRERHAHEDGIRRLHHHHGGARVVVVDRTEQHRDHHHDGHGFGVAKQHDEHHLTDHDDHHHDDDHHHHHDDDYDHHHDHHHDASHHHHDDGASDHHHDEARHDHHHGRAPADIRGDGADERDNGAVHDGRIARCGSRIGARRSVTGHDVVAALTSRDPTKAIGPVKVLVSGGIGTGKTSVLADIRSALRDAGMTVIARPPRAGDPAGAAVVIDDAHLLGASDLEQLAELVGDPATTVVIAAEPLAHHPALSALSTALARQSPVVALTALTPAEVHQEIAEIAGAAPPVEMVRAVMTTTAGLPFLVRPAVAALAAPDGEAPVEAAARAARVALIERLRRVDEAVLDTLLVSSLSPELGPDDVAAALRTDGGQAHTLVDRARASGLIAPSHSHTFLGSLHESLAQIIGATRHYDIEVALVRTQIEKSTLSMDLALKLADHGLRNPQLADALTDLAARNRAHPGQAARLYRAATEVGATALNARLADALALTGDCGTAGRLADELLASDDPDGACRCGADRGERRGSRRRRSSGGRVVPLAGPLLRRRRECGRRRRDDRRRRRRIGTRVRSPPRARGPPTSTARAARSLVEGLVADAGLAVSRGDRPPGPVDYVGPTGLRRHPRHACGVW